MTAHNLPSAEFDELLSAYLDGELSASERARVDQRLASDAAARQLLADLDRTSQSLKSLPRHRADATLQSCVMAAAAAANVLPQRPADSRRGLMWATLAVAAALLLMVTQREVDDQPLGPVAQAPQTTPKVPPMAGEAVPTVDAPMAVPAVRSSARLESEANDEAASATQGAIASARARIPSSESVATSSPPGVEHGVSSVPLRVYVQFTSSPRREFALENLLSAHGIELMDSNPSTAAQEVPKIAELEASDERRRIERVLVEAPQEQIEHLLAACGKSPLCNNLRIEFDDEAPPPLRGDSWRQFHVGARSNNHEPAHPRIAEDVPPRVGWARRQQSDQENQGASAEMDSFARGDRAARGSIGKGAQAMSGETPFRFWLIIEWQPLASAPRK